MLSQKYCVPMFESERGWGSKIDGYAGPFDTIEAAQTFRIAYNAKHNPPMYAPDWYIMALEPTPWSGQRCDYRVDVAEKITTVDGIAAAQALCDSEGKPISFVYKEGGRTYTIDLTPKTNEETATERWTREAIERKECQQCAHCGWEPDSDLYCGHPEAFRNISPFGGSFNAMERAGLCTNKGKQLWEQRHETS